MIIDCYGHCTAEPAALIGCRKEQLAGAESNLGFGPSATAFRASDGEMREKLEQLKFMRERGLTLFSPVGMGHHLGAEQTACHWAQIGNDTIRRVCDLSFRPRLPTAAMRRAEENGSRNSRAASTPRPVSTTNGGAGRSRATRAGRIRGSEREAGPRCPRA